jgi:single-strand DNA-binding protein
MANLNKVFLMGNLTRDPELRYTPGGTAVASFGIAVNRRWTGQNGEQREETLFIDVNAFGRQAEVISEYLSKGRGVFIEGRLKLDQWQDKETGANRSKHVVVVDSFQFIGGPGGPGGQGGQGGQGEEGGSRGSRGGSRQGSRPASTSTPSPAPAEEAAPAEDDDIPF